jgi:hypothetical protein
MAEEIDDGIGRAGGREPDLAAGLGRLLHRSWAEVSPSVRAAMARAATRALAEETRTVLLGEVARGR